MAGQCQPVDMGWLKHGRLSQTIPQKVLSFIAGDNGGMTLVEEKQGKALHGMDLPVHEQLDEDDEEED